MSEEQAKPAPKHNRFWLYAPWGAFIVIAIAWCTYWFVLAEQIETRLAQWIAAQNQAGGQAQIGRIERHGFPSMLRFVLEDVSYAPRNRAFTLETDRISLEVNLTDPRNFYFVRKAPFTLIQGETRTALDASSAVVSLTLRESGLTYFGLEADQARMDNPQAEGVLTLGHIVANARPDPRNEANWQIALLADALHVARPIEAFEQLGQDFPHIQAALVWTPQQRTHIDTAEIQWGPANARVDGEIGLDDAHRFDGALNISTPRASLAYLPSGLRAATLARQPTQDPVRFALQASDGSLRADSALIRPLTPLY